MKRLTKEICGRAHGAEGVSEDKLTGAYCRGEFEATAIVERLFAYENTGFEPHEIEEQKFFIAAQKDPDKLKRLRELVEADANGKCIIAPVGIGDTVYHIAKCGEFRQVYDGTLYGDNGEHGTATGLYCPCELAETCPFPCDEDGGFDCEQHKDTFGIFEDVVTEIHIDDIYEYAVLDYSGSVDFEEFGIYAFTDYEEAKAALEGMRK